MQSLETKVPPPMLMLILGIVMVSSAGFLSKTPMPALWAAVMGCGIAVLGAVINAQGFMALRRHNSTINPINPSEASTIVQVGPFRWSRNPMYVGFTLLLLGLAVGLNTPVLLLAPISYIAYMTRFQIIPEERALLQKFGKQYGAYKSSVRRWI